jgi:sucrose phosphorylase
LSARDALIICYADMLREDGVLPLGTLGDFARRRLAGTFSFMHILPFFPSSSDEGFSVMDYGRVDPRLGDWQHVARIRQDLGLAFDLVLNHASAKGAWFRGFLAGQEPFSRYFVTRGAGFDTAGVFRPRTHPLLTGFTRDDGTDVHVWTTFSPDQVDLDYSDPEVLLEMVGVALSYVAHGAGILRLDAVAYAWKEDGTNCLDRPQVHALVRLFRAVLDWVAPGVRLLTETNLPEAINDSYFGKGDEAHLVYNFPLPPLALHAFMAQRADYLASWAAGQSTPPAGGIRFNFLSSHDGIGLAPAKGLLPAAEIGALVEGTRRRGGLVSERATPDGPVPYELNTTFLDAIADPEADDGARARAFLACHAAMVALAGIPAIWFHSLVGSRNWADGPAAGGSRRSVNRQRLAPGPLERELDDSGSLRSKVFGGMTALLAARSRRPAFDPASPQRILSPDGSGGILGSTKVPCPAGPLFVVLRGRGDGAVLTAVNVSERAALCRLPRGFAPRGPGFDPAGGQVEAAGADATPAGGVVVPPHGVVWMDGRYEGG